MKLFKQLLFAAILFTCNLTYTAWPMGLNSESWDLYVKKAHIKLEEAKKELQSEDQRYEWTHASYTDALYGRQKKAFKLLLEEINSNENDEILKKHFKHEYIKIGKSHS